MMDVDDKTKDNENAKMELTIYRKRLDLEINELFK